MRTPTRDEVIRTILGRSRRIAVVGASPDPSRPSHGVVTRLVRAGFEVVPVNPNTPQVQGLPTVPSLAEVAGQVDLVDVFRRPEHAPDLVRQAVEVEAGAVWLQLGVVSPEAARLAAEAGLPYVEDACLAVEVDRHRSTLPPLA